MTSLRERHKSLNTMLCLLQGLVGQETTIELRTEDHAYGKIVNVDGFMNVDMENVTYTTHSGDKNTFDSFYIYGKNIRFVRIPDDVNIRHTMSKQLKIIQGVRTNQERKKRVPYSKEELKQIKEEKIRKKLELTRAAISGSALAKKSKEKRML